MPFSALRQLPGWGAPHPSAIDTSKVYGVQFQVNEKGAPFDVWIDERNGSVDVEWGVRRWSDLHPPEVAPGYIQSPHRGQR